ncbi:PREDICTED: transmembrane protein 185B-like [Amphimedon queenslandica]|uniref:Uncharacterized protein n=1 Tax=Amphimedon queenslandica TaxID=400682 RepID=A0A1X7UU12_AMPQE|nr:PREDICTED: transmembrane protein 185B-like [Amphimedon queenslandica]|eukprot:XP_019852342.1 PREDICTED: transmembrane protein 185B-like [Amphimedon queenslandica]
MHLKELLNRFNVSHFLFYCLLILQLVLIGLRADGIISGPYSALFFPLWLWNVLVGVAVVMGVVRWCKSSRDYREDSELLYQFKSMLLSVFFQSFIFITLLLIAVNIDTSSMPWSVSLSPLFLLPFFSIPSCLWSCYRKRSYEIEVMSMAFLLQFIFLAVRLDGAVNWAWSVVFIPIWLLFLAYLAGMIVMGVSTGLVYLLGENQQDLEQRKLPDILYFVFSSLLLLCLIIFMSLLSSRLDNNITGPYSAILIPLYLSLFCLIGLSTCRKPTNVWWFGIRKSFSDFLLLSVPLLQEYINVSYYNNQHTVLPTKDDEDKNKIKKKPEEPGTLDWPYEDIYAPE